MDIPTFTVEKSKTGNGWWIVRDKQLFLFADKESEANDVRDEFERHTKALNDIYINHCPPLLKEALLKSSS